MRGGPEAGREREKALLAGPLADAPRCGDVTGRLQTASYLLSATSVDLFSLLGMLPFTRAEYARTNPDVEVFKSRPVSARFASRFESVAFRQWDWAEDADSHLTSAFTEHTGAGLCGAVFRWAGSGRCSVRDAGGWSGTGRELQRCCTYF